MTLGIADMKIVCFVQCRAGDVEQRKCIPTQKMGGIAVNADLNFQQTGKMDNLTSRMRMKTQINYKQTIYIAAALGFGYVTLFLPFFGLLTFGLAAYCALRAYEERNKK
jgi:hypothetical protein